jgi:hypothetical protein
MFDQKISPAPNSLAGMPEGKSSRTKVIRVSGIPGANDLNLVDKEKIHLEIRTASGEEVLGYLDLGAISYWRDPDEDGKGRRMYWENFQRWMNTANQPKASKK